MLRRLILPLLSSAPEYRLWLILKTEHYTPVSVVSEALETIVLFRIERRYHLQPGSRILSKTTKKRQTNKQVIHFVFIAISFRVYQRGGKFHQCPTVTDFFHVCLYKPFAYKTTASPRSLCGITLTRQFRNWQDHGTQVIYCSLFTRGRMLGGSWRPQRLARISRCRLD